MIRGGRFFACASTHTNRAKRFLWLMTARELSRPISAETATRGLRVKNYANSLGESKMEQKYGDQNRWTQRGCLREDKGGMKKPDTKAASVLFGVELETVIPAG